METKILDLTTKLKDLNNQAYIQFTNKTKKLDYVVDFFGEVKPFADQVQVLADEWKELARDWVIANKPKYVFPIQINDTHENITIAAVLAYQLETRDNNFKQKRFLEMIKSIDYVLDALQKGIQNS